MYKKKRNHALKSHYSVMNDKFDPIQLNINGVPRMGLDYKDAI